MTNDEHKALTVRRLTKRFFGTLALHNAELEVKPGQIHALVGENGAGKSTLIKILAGVYHADSGEIAIGGEAVRPGSEELPISFVHQDLGLVDSLSVAENIALVAGFPRRHRLIQWREVRRRAVELYESMGIASVDPEVPVATLTAAQKAILGIVRGLARQASFIVLDEPTAALPEPDARHLFQLLKDLAAKGTGIIYVSHRLSELFGLVHHITVLRDGRTVKSVAAANTNASEIVESMLGRTLQQMHTSETAKRDSRRLVEISGLRVAHRGPFTFQLHVGEILGLVGLQGAGHEHIARVLYGAKQPDSGHIVFAGERLPLFEPIEKRIARGITFLSSDRNGESTFPGMSLRENLFPNPRVNGFERLQYMSPRAERARTQAALGGLDVRPNDPNALIDWLSGGNQQKICIGRWLVRGGELLMFEEPTAGVDIGAKTEIHRMLREAALKGASILVISSDFEEVATLCDRALVVAGGSIHRELSGTGWTEDDIVAAATMGAA